MTDTYMSPTTRELVAEAVFSRVLVGVDGSPEGLEAARQAAALREPGGLLDLVSSYDLVSALHGGLGMAPALLDEETERVLVDEYLEEAAEAIRETATPATKIVRGRSWEALIDEVERGQHTALVVGSHGTGRMAGIVVGSTVTEVLHKAPCSVLVAREGATCPPTTIVVGVDGSPESALAYETASHLATRFGARLRPLLALGGKEPDSAAIKRSVDLDHACARAHPVAALVAASASADLVVVGSRGLHGVRALGSVSERVAHQAQCSVLVARPRAIRA